MGTAIVEHVDHAADCLATVAQGGGAAHDLDAARRERIDRHAMIRTNIGNVRTARAIFKDAHAVASMPWMIGRLAPAAKPEPAMPGVSASASAMLAPPLLRIWFLSTLATIAGVSSKPCLKGEAVMTIVS